MAPDFPIPQPFAAINGLRELTTAGSFVGAYAIGLATGLSIGDRPPPPPAVLSIVLELVGPMLVPLEPVEREIIAAAAARVAAGVSTIRADA